LLTWLHAAADRNGIPVQRFDDPLAILMLLAFPPEL
jgi:hypothetical protein